MSPHLSRRTVTLACAGFLVVLLSAIAALLPVPYVALSPGPTTNTLGSVDGNQLISITGHKTYQDTGHLNLTTVSVLGGPAQRMDLVTALRGWLDGSIAVIPEEQVYPKGQTAKQSEQESTDEMRDSQESATTAALRSLDIPVVTHVSVNTIAAGSPAAGKLKANDEIIQVDTKPIAGGAALRSLITAHKAGDPVTFLVERGGKRTDVTVTTAKAPEDGRTIVGITTRDLSTYPFTVKIGLKDVGGPSAGLMFALGIVDKLTPGSLTGGAFVAGTGTIDDAGTVGPIGGIAQKMIAAKRAGATVFLAPPGDCAEAITTVPDGLRLVRAKSLASALASLDALRTNKAAKVPTCA
jgi:PDZ domain-containing protein